MVPRFVNMTAADGLAMLAWEEGIVAPGEAQHEACPGHIPQR